MLISIVIPTRDRAEVLRYSLAACTRICDPKIEIIVSDNSSVDETPEAVARSQDSRIRYVRTPQRYSMRQNFEFAVNHARGDYICMLGDDDAPIPNQFPHLRALLERYSPDTLTGSLVRYAWPSPEAAHNGGRLKLRFKSLYGGCKMVSGEQLRSGLESDGAVVARFAPRIYGGVASRRVVEGLRSKTGQLFMATSPDIYFIFASPSQIKRHLVVTHPFFIGGSSPRSNGASYHRWRRNQGDGAELKKFLDEGNSDPIVDVIPLASSLQINSLSHLESANRYAFDGALSIDYEREFERAIRSLDELDEGRRQIAVETLAQFASERGLSPALCDVQTLLGRCRPVQKTIRSRPNGKSSARSYLSLNRVAVDLTSSNRTDIDAAAAAYEHLIGNPAIHGGLARRFAWAKLVGRAFSLMRRPGSFLPAQAVLRV